MSSDSGLNTRRKTERVPQGTRFSFLRRWSLRLFLLVSGALPVSLSAAEVSGPRPLLPDAAAWQSLPAIPGLQFTWLLGSEATPAPYLLRVRLAQGARIPAHTHPDERNTTVLSGTLYVGFGATFDEGAVVPIPAGAVYVAPAGVPHTVWARDGAVEYQEAGHGPTATRISPP